jgi:hypothetical protein
MPWLNCHVQVITLDFAIPQSLQPRSIYLPSRQSVFGGTDDSSVTRAMKGRSCWTWTSADPFLHTSISSLPVPSPRPPCSDPPSPLPRDLSVCATLLNPTHWLQGTFLQPKPHLILLYGHAVGAPPVGYYLNPSAGPGRFHNQILTCLSHLWF